MFKDLNLLDDHEVVIVRRHAQHHAVLHIQWNLARISILPASSTAQSRTLYSAANVFVSRSDLCSWCPFSTKLLYSAVSALFTTAVSSAAFGGF